MKGCVVVSTQDEIITLVITILNRTKIYSLEFFKRFLELYPEGKLPSDELVIDVRDAVDKYFGYDCDLEYPFREQYLKEYLNYCQEPDDFKILLKSVKVISDLLGYVDIKFNQTKNETIYVGLSALHYSGLISGRYEYEYVLTSCEALDGFQVGSIQLYYFPLFDEPRRRAAYCHHTDYSNIWVPTKARALVDFVCNFDADKLGISKIDLELFEDAEKIARLRGNDVHDTFMKNMEKYI